jgi:sulfatase modifying factor 1
MAMQPSDIVTRAPGPIAHPLSDGFAPAWAAAWGDDEFGPFADLEVRGADRKRVVQRFRWIPPGTFWMGSPRKGEGGATVDEPGRYENEGPRHRVTLTQGFWMADTPCTQELWVAVMRTNPSHFKSLRHPVEQVSWLDVQKFLKRLNGDGQEMLFDLPTEAQWEYACRADAETALYQTAAGNGAIEIVGEHNAPALDPIAWYGGNSAVAEGIENGWDVSDWKERQFSHQRASTQPVGLKLPNDWRLYDMLGNVWEWCLDRWTNYKAEAAVDPNWCGQRDGGVSRVFRGGRWNSHARSVRCAVRSRRPADDQDFYLGFRLVRVQEPS